MTNELRNSRKTKTGVVVSAKMDKTVVVRVERIYSHSQYLKVARSSKKYYAHNTFDLSEGDKVQIEETRPLSKSKRWRVVARMD
ncbi:30S ribosomal protein S17 [Candidatus Chlamydia sanziniae]|uniref:Small ribosomal subunit protein uS17 n=1 Tax=Candidatus Chlamydia sanziniae TaxID=1806891 RepID=A0A1A9HTX2_9CHLA|nr:30S ribosomal protein S17 [Candidatus Chlamydia sanziniae]ANH78439.1 SSU ribosomal protein S17p [Candidatus Chlamydia sanziniae]